MRHLIIRRVLFVLFAFLLFASALALFWIRPAAQSVEYHLRRAQFFARQVTNNDEPDTSLQQTQSELVAAQPDLESVGAFLDALQFLRPAWRALPYVGARLDSYVRLWQTLRYGTRVALSGTNLALDLLAARNETENNPLTRALQWVYQHRAEVKRRLADFHQASTELAQVRAEDLPDSFRADFEKYAPLVARADTLAQQLDPLFDSTRDAAGFNGPRTYLILFQNNLELRPTGGFIGEYAVAEIELGDLVSLQIADSYDFPTTETLRLAPFPSAQPLRDYFGEPFLAFRDINWSPDFPTDARSASTYFKNEYGRAPEGVIALDVSLARDFLQALGPVQIAESDAPITAENFYARYLAIRTADPNYKEVLASIGRELLNRLRGASPTQSLALATALEKSLRDKEILIWFSQPDLQKWLNANGWDGQVRSFAGDYLFINDANVSGEKNSLQITNQARAEMSFDEAGTLHTTLVVTSTNYAPSTQRVFRRVYLPANAQVQTLDWNLTTAQGFIASAQARWENNHVITQTVNDPSNYFLRRLNGEWKITGAQNEFDKTVIAFPFVLIRPSLDTLTDLPPNELGIPSGVGVMRLTYTVANAIRARAGESEYHLLIQKQPGASAIPFTLRLTLPRNAKLITENAPAGETNIWEKQFDLQRDEEIIVRFH